MSEAIANGNARYEIVMPNATYDDFEGHFYLPGCVFDDDFVPPHFPSDLENLQPAGSEIPNARISRDTLEDSVEDSVQDSNQAFLTPGCANNPIDLTESGDPVKVLGLALLNNPLEFEVLRELDYWAAAKAAHLWVRAEENEALRATTSYKLIQTLAFELQQVAKKLEF